MIKCIVLILCTATAVLARSATSELNQISVAPNTETVDTMQQLHTPDEIQLPSKSIISKSSSDTTIWGDFDFIFKTYQKCSKSDMSVCLKLKLVNVLDNASRSIKNIELIQGVKFVTAATSEEQRNEINNVTPVQSEDELMRSLPRSLEGKESALTSLIWDKVSTFFQTHTIQVSTIDAYKL